ncbi:hypothetical protein ACUXPG_000172 [Staphylococcus hominis]
MALNIRKVVAQSAENNQKIYKKDNFYNISIEIVSFIHPETLCLGLAFIMLSLFNILHNSFLSELHKHLL